ncbi:MAG TPA: hypothetical protein VFU02_17955 [Polyangiaceae bacterium]|nr:hypothetical protein [Polyangiaceae bacterium]
MSSVTSGEFGRVSVVHELARTLMLGPLLESLRERHGLYQLLDHWTQGEFHHDLVVRVPVPLRGLPGPILVIATNCNGGVKEVLCFATPPSRGALWSRRCPDNSEFEGALPPLLDRAITTHWFDPCELLEADARSELRVECRERQPGGGWMKKAND